MPKKILIIDDDRDLVELLSQSLRRLGHFIAATTTGAEAFQKARSFRPDLILLDLLLPDVNGLNLCEMLRNYPPTANIPIIMTTIMPGEFPRLVAFEAGANAYLNKPVNLQQLLTSVTGFLGGTPDSAALSDSSSRNLAA
jgi:two-component system, OmpR family, alkaline phosphatase synthesis response regulator PhoP